MTDPHVWIQRHLGRSDRERLNELRFRLVPGRTVGLADLVAGWYSDVSRLVAESVLPADASTAWSEHDLVATLLTRDRIRRLIADVPAELIPAVEAAIAEVDGAFARYSTPDRCGCTERVYGEPAPPGAWWWHRAPTSGPVPADLIRHYGHPPPR